MARKRVVPAYWSNRPEVEWDRGIEWPDQEEWRRGVSFIHKERIVWGRRTKLGIGVRLHCRYDGRIVFGDNVSIGSGVFIEGKDVTVGNNVSIGPDAKILTTRHTLLPPNMPAFQTDVEILPVVIEDGVIVGVGAIILPGVSIGRGAVVADGAVVTKDVPFGAIVAGVPARILRYRGGDDVDRSRWRENDANSGS